MSAPSQQESIQPASILDIVLFGYKSLLKHLWPITKLSLPVLIPYSLIATLFQMMEGNTKKHPTSLEEGMTMLVAGVGMAVCSLALGYLYYAIARYVRDVNWDEVEPNIYAYLIPKRSLLGSLGIWLLAVVMVIPVFIAGLLGLLLLVIPGLAIFSLYNMAFYLLLVIYLGNPKQGVFEAISEMCRLLKGNLWRTAGLGFVAFLPLLIFVVLLVLLMLIGVFVGALVVAIIQNKESLEPLLAVLYGILMGVNSWISLVVGQGGLYFVLYRYYYDLKQRAAA